VWRASWIRGHASVLMGRRRRAPVGVFFHQLMISPLPDATNSFNCRMKSAS